jgi:hypothetical protein
VESEFRETLRLYDLCVKLVLGADHLVHRMLAGVRESRDSVLRYDLLKLLVERGDLLGVQDPGPVLQIYIDAVSDIETLRRSIPVVELICGSAAMVCLPG